MEFFRSKSELRQKVFLEIHKQVKLRLTKTSHVKKRLVYNWFDIGFEISFGTGFKTGFGTGFNWF